MYIFKRGSTIGLCFITEAGLHRAKRLDVPSELDLIIDDNFINKSGDYPGELFCIFNLDNKKIITNQNGMGKDRLFLYSKRENWVKITNGT